MADSSDVDNAIVTALQADTGAGGVATLMPGGIYVDEAPAGVTQFVIVSLVDEADVDVFERRAAEEALYLVEARELSTVAVKNIKAAAARIDALLKNGSLTATGYAAVTTRRESRTRITEVDDLDSSIRWQRRGGRYRAMATPA
ncbi:MAG: hypothetical protein ABI665_14660 [Vicinamibacterales bacterium]